MESAKICRENAQKFLASAAGTNEVGARNSLLEIASAWLSIAERCEDIHRHSQSIRKTPTSAGPREAETDPSRRPVHC